MEQEYLIDETIFEERPIEIIKNEPLTIEKPTKPLQCPYCDSKKLDFKPINIPYKTCFDNEDLGVFASCIDMLPTLTQALLSGVNSNQLLLFCENCKQICSNTDDYNKNEIRRAIKIKYPEAMIL